MNRHIREVAVLGAGTMGARIAAHFANAFGPQQSLERSGPPRNEIDCIAREGGAKASGAAGPINVSRSKAGRRKAGRYRPRDRQAP